MAAQDITPGDVELVRSADMRYRRQVNEVEVRIAAGLLEGGSAAVIEAFEQEYARLFGEGTGYAAAGFAITGVRVRATASTREFRPTELPTQPPDDDAWRGDRDLLFPATGRVRRAVHVYDGHALAPERRVSGPAIVEFPDTSVIVQTDATAMVDRFGSVVIES
jgi:N-methylhydantoinase A